MTPPKLPAFFQAHPNGFYLRVWCRYCRCYHVHGAATLGHRLAHCRGDSPYVATGYTLIDAGAMPAWMVRDAARRKPLGPERWKAKKYREVFAEKERAPFRALRQLSAIGPE